MSIRLYVDRYVSVCLCMGMSRECVSVAVSLYCWAKVCLTDAPHVVTVDVDAAMGCSVPAVVGALLGYPAVYLTSADHMSSGDFDGSVPVNANCLSGVDLKLIK